MLASPLGRPSGTASETLFSPFGLLILMATPYAISVWQEYQTGIFVTSVGQMGVTEAQFFQMTYVLLPFVFGNNPNLYPTTKVGDLITIAKDFTKVGDLITIGKDFSNTIGLSAILTDLHAVLTDIIIIGNTNFFDIIGIIGKSFNYNLSAIITFLTDNNIIGADVMANITTTGADITNILSTNLNLPNVPSWSTFSEFIVQLQLNRFIICVMTLPMLQFVIKSIFNVFRAKG